MLHHRLVLPLLLAAVRVAIGSADPVSRHRSLQQQINGTNVAVDDSCSESPFIWLIRKQGGSNGAAPLGFAVGILENLPEEQLVSDGAWQSIKDVANDSCAVYGESIFTAGCLFGFSNDIYENSATVNDIPDPDLRERYVQRLRQIAVDHIGDDVTGWVERLSSRPLWGVFEILALDNTPEVRESSLPPLFTLTLEDDAPQWATAVLDLGTLKGQLETREESCDWWDEEYVLLREELLQDYDAEWADRLELALTAGYSSLAQQYKCGDLEGIENTFANNHNTVPAHILDQTYNCKYCTSTATKNGSYSFVYVGHQLTGYLTHSFLFATLSCTL